MNDIFDKLKKGIFTKNYEETISIGEKLAKELEPNTKIALYGNLGVGKTTFVKGVAKGLGISQEITSPTFNIFSIYSGKWQLIHIDAYRISSKEPQDDLMIDDFTKEPYCIVIEWPQNVPILLDPPIINLELSILHSKKEKFKDFEINKHYHHIKMI